MMGDSEIGPERIRAIRKHLRLTQVEAGRLLGGGPRAFAKYESDALKPSASVVNLLRVLEAHPDAIVTLGGSMPRRSPSQGPLPFEIGGEDIERLTPSDMHGLLRRLLSMEAIVNDIPPDSIHVPSNVNACDGGEDGRIKWTSDPDRTRFLPGKFCQFQAKAGKIGPSEAAREALKPMVRQVLQSGGCYIIFCGSRYVQQLIERREAAVHDALLGAGIDIEDHQIGFRDADQIANWVNFHQPVAMWVTEHTQPGTIGPFRPWSHWAGRAEHAALPCVQDERLLALAAWLGERVRHVRSISRVVGFWGVGKSRLTLQALRRGGDFVSHLVMYAVESECGAVVAKQIVQNLADSGTRAIVVVDQCSPETHRDLASFASRSKCGLSLITIDDEVPAGDLDDMTFNVPEAATSVTEAIINRTSPGLPFEDQRRLARFSEGFPAVARRIAQVWTTLPVAQATDDDLVDAFVLGRNPSERALLLKSACLLATFGLVRVESEGDKAAQHAEIAELGRSLTTDDFYALVQELTARGVAQRRGGVALLRPRPIAINLAKRQWNEWSPTRWDEVLAGDISPDLKVSAARQLVLLNDLRRTPIAERVVGHLCRTGGPFAGVVELTIAGHGQVLSVLAEIDAAKVAEQIKRILNDIEGGSQIRRDVGAYLVTALEKIAFDSGTFEEGARLLLRLALVQPEVWTKSPCRQFRALFPVLLGNTEADGGARLSLLDELRHSDDAKQLAILATALAAGAKTSHFIRDVGAETCGSRPALEPWRPETRIEIDEYISLCVKWLSELAKRDDAAGSVARTELAKSLRSLVPDGFIDIVETIVPQVTAAVPQWTDALESLGRVLTQPNIDLPVNVGERVRKLIAELLPQDLMTRVRFLITEMPWDYPYEAAPDHETKYRRKVEAVRGVTRELVKHPAVLKGVLPDVGRGRQRMAHVFGEALADTVDSPDEWLDGVVGAVAEAPCESRNYDLLAGYLAGLAARAPRLLETAKGRVARSRELAPALPQIFQRLRAFQEVTAADVGLLIDAVNGSRLSPLGFGQGLFGAVLTRVPPGVAAPLFDVLIDHSAEAFSEVVQMIATYVYGATYRLEELRPQIRRIAESVTRWDGIPDVAMVRGCFGEIMNWMLRKGREEPDARATALALARALVAMNGYDQSDLLTSIAPLLLSGFPEIVWPLVGQAMISGEHESRKIVPMLPLIELPEDTMFAWCHAHPDRAPAVAARRLPVVQGAELHRRMVRLLDEFGERPGVLQAVDLNMGNFICDGSGADFLARYDGPLQTLRQHRIPKVRTWAKQMLMRYGEITENLRRRDEEYAARAQMW